MLSDSRRVRVADSAEVVIAVCSVRDGCRQPWIIAMTATSLALRLNTQSPRAGKIAARLSPRFGSHLVFRFQPQKGTFDNVVRARGQENSGNQAGRRPKEAMGEGRMIDHVRANRVVQVQGVGNGSEEAHPFPVDPGP